jgi:hypothetical protein
LLDLIVQGGQRHPDPGQDLPDQDFLEDRLDGVPVPGQLGDLAALNQLAVAFKADSPPVDATF